MHALGDVIVIAYLVGATVNGCVVFCGCLMGDRSGLRKATALGILAGAAWPVVTIGVIQMLLIATVFDWVRHIARAAKSRTERAHATPVDTAGLRSTSSHSSASIAHRCTCCPPASA